MSKSAKHPFIVSSGDKHHAWLLKRRGSEKRFIACGFFSVALSILFLGFLLFTIFSKGSSAFMQTYIKLNVEFTESEIDPEGDRDPAKLIGANYSKLIQNALKLEFPEVTERGDIVNLYAIVSKSASKTLREMVKKDPTIVGTTQEVWVKSSSDVDMLIKGKVDLNVEEFKRNINNQQVEWAFHLKALGRVEKKFNTTFFTSGDSREAEQAGILGSIMGSFFVIIICLVFAIPIGVSAAIYLEEFAARNKYTDIIEVGVNNLAAVPSIVYGLLGLAVFLNFFELPRSASIVGGLTLSLLVLPTIVITTRNSLATVPPSIKDAAMALGATKMQVLLHHTLPLSMPGIMTGAILSIARALGETAPLLMIGMVAFVRDIPHNVMDPATALPVQVFIWSDLPEAGFAEKTSGAIIILLALLVIFNSFAVYLRKKFEQKW
jgi:phosphate transport system permease protein